MAILGIDIGGTKTAVVAGTEEGGIAGRTQFPTCPDRGFDDFLDRVEEAIGAVGESVSCFACVSISVGGPMDEEAGLLLCPPHLPGWNGLPLTARFSERLKIPVFMMHDARAGAYAEWRFGTGRETGVRNMAFLTFATGFGLGVVLNGRLLKIPGEVGHWRVAEDGPELFGKRGSLEGLASGTGIEAQARAAGFYDEEITLPVLAERARKGESMALELFDGMAVQAGRQCARLIDLFGLDAIALGTIAVHAGDLLLDRICEVAREEALEHLGRNCRIVPAALGEDLGDVASLSAAISRGETGGSNSIPGADAGLTALFELAESVHADRDLVDGIDRAAGLVLGALKSGKKVLTCGNGGSATDAAHLSEELVGRYRGNRRALPAICLNADSAALTCIANDFGFEEVFSRQVEAFGHQDDVLVVFSTSGQSGNVNRALARANQRGLSTIALLGKKGGAARDLADVALIIPSDDSARIQELHTFVLHAICEAVEHAFPPDS